MFRIVMDGLLSGAHPHASGQVLTGTQVAAPPGVGAAGDLQPDAVSWLKAMGCHPEIDLDLEAAVRLALPSSRFHAKKTIADVGGASLGGHVA
jgi:hypothetical protein